MLYTLTRSALTNSSGTLSSVESSLMPSQSKHWNAARRILATPSRLGLFELRREETGCLLSQACVSIEQQLLYGMAAVDEAPT